MRWPWPKRWPRATILKIVNYPGLSSGRHAHPQSDLVSRQMKLTSGMLSFVPAARDGRSPEERARRFAEGTRIFALAELLGGVESLVEIPAVMTHGSVANSPLEVSAALVRLSVGIENAADLVADVLGSPRPRLKERAWNAGRRSSSPSASSPSSRSASRRGRSARRRSSRRATTCSTCTPTTS